MSFVPTGLTPLLAVFDMPTALHFYRDVIGFEVVSASPEVTTREGRFSHWMWLRLGPVDLMLNTQFDSNERPDLRDAARNAAHGDTSLYIGCRDVATDYEALIERGLQAAPPKLASYGVKQFSAHDPDGYLIVFQEVG